MNIYIILAVAIGSFLSGWKVESWRWEASMADMVKEAHATYVTRDVVKEKIVKQYIDRMIPIETVIREVSNEAQTMAPSPTCPAVPNRFVELHDDSAASRHPGAPGPTDGAPSEITPAKAVGVIGENYGLYHKLSAQVEGLQRYVREVCLSPGRRPTS